MTIAVFVNVQSRISEHFFEQTCMIRLIVFVAANQMLSAGFF